MKEPNIYIDGGYRYGEGFAHMRGKYGINGGWTKLGFEPNPFIRHTLPNWVLNAALSNSWGLCQFRAQLIQGNRDGEGSTMVPGFKIQGLCDPVEVPKIRMADVIKGLMASHWAGGDHRPIIMKLDVEGAEFAIIDDLEQQDCLKYIHTAHIEWHAHMMCDGIDYQWECSKQMQIIKDAGVRLTIHW